MKKWLCAHGLHRWKYFKKNSKRLVFYERCCARCGRLEIKSIGRLGDGKWRLPEKCFNGPSGDFEREQFNIANGTSKEPESFEGVCMRCHKPTNRIVTVGCVCEECAGLTLVSSLLLGDDDDWDKWCWCDPIMQAESIDDPNECANCGRPFSLRKEAK